MKSVLVDKSVGVVYSWFDGAIDLEFYKTIIHPKIQSLMNRNSANIVLLEKILNVVTLDFSSLFKEYFTLVKESLIDDVKSEKALPVLKKII